MKSQSDWLSLKLAKVKMDKNVAEVTKAERIELWEKLLMQVGFEDMGVVSSRKAWHRLALITDDLMMLGVWNMIKTVTRSGPVQPGFCTDAIHKAALDTLRSTLLAP